VPVRRRIAAEAHKFGNLPLTEAAPQPKSTKRRSVRVERHD
jgi:hypothetical protein